MLDRPVTLVTTVLLGNELANVLTSHLVTNYFHDTGFSAWQVTLLNILLVAPTFMLVGEISPKVLGAKANTSMANFLIDPFWFLYRFSFPLRFLFEGIVNLLTRNLKKPKDVDSIKEEDFRMLLEDGKIKGAIHSMEQDIIENIFEIDDDKVIEIATPIQECLTVHQGESLKETVHRLSDTFYNRIPVRGDKPGEIVGILYAKDLLNYINREETEMTVKDLMKEPLFVDAKVKAEVVFQRFRQLKRHIAVVTDAQGKALAVVTMEDILEQMFGELWEES